MSATGYHDIPVVEHYPDRNGHAIPVGTGDMVIERNEGVIEVYIKIPDASPMYKFITDPRHTLLELRLGAAVQLGQAKAE